MKTLAATLCLFAIAVQAYPAEDPASVVDTTAILEPVVFAPLEDKAVEVNPAPEALVIQPADTVVNTDVVDGLVDPNTINESELPTVEDIAPVNFETTPLQFAPVDDTLVFAPIEETPAEPAPIEKIALIATKAIQYVNDTVSGIKQRLDANVDMIAGKLEEIREMIGPLSSQMYAAVLFQDLDTVAQTLSGLTQEVENAVQTIADDFNSRVNSNFDVVFSRLDCQTDEQQFAQTVGSCVDNMEATLYNLAESISNTNEDIATNVSSLVDLINACRGKTNPILKAKCAVLNVKKVVTAAETIRNDLESVAQLISANIQELSMNFEMCIPACQ